MASCGYDHTLVVTQDGALWACGEGGNGRLGLNDVAKRYVSVFERVGAGAFGGVRIVAAAAGPDHSAAVTEDGALWTWGQGFDARLGHGDEDNRFVPTVVSGAGLGGGRFGRCRGLLPAEHALAFAMGTHWRLGGETDAHCSVLAAEPGLVGMIVGMCCGRLGLHAGEWLGCAGQGLVRLLGGGDGGRGQ